MMEKGIKIKVILLSVVLFAVVYLAFYYLFPLLFPFILAYLLSILIHYLVNKALKFLHWKRSFLTGFFLLLFFTVLGVLSYFAAKSGFVQVQNSMRQFSYFQEKLFEFTKQFSEELGKITGIPADQILYFLDTCIKKVEMGFQSDALNGMLNHSFRYMGSLFNGIGCLFVIIITAFFLAKDFDEIHWKMRDYFWYRDIRRIYKRVTDVAGIYLRAQVIIMTCVGIFTCVCLFLLGQSYWLLLGLLIGLMDALPFFGTGTVFVPWGIICLFRGDLFHAAAYLSIYVVTAFMREFMEPKLIGNRLGISPIFVIASIYIGLQIYGIKGVLLGPLSFLVYMEILREILEKYSVDLKKI